MAELRVSVVYAEAARQLTRELSLTVGSTVADAIRNAEIPVDAQAARVGIFGRVVDPATLLRDGDRVEIYRPLKIDPKEARRRRAAK
jgi:putative ubiquitin-RnfH superfamily antitoxin RatB of RatAB toxin-antitoxin module